MADEFNASFVEGGIIHGGGVIPTPSGETGADGKSAYEIAVENGFSGTVTEWLASLKGAKGDKGDRGEQGIKGDKGDKGADGSQGIQGVQGERGEKGETGEKGADGKDGLNGKDGVNGKDGKDGLNGVDGKDGTDGKSAYELAVANGFSGTLAEWLNSLKGSDGKDGKDGAKGDKGDKGDTGAQGIQGADGAKGDKGDKGDSGVEQQIVIDSAVTSYAIKPNILYVFPEESALTITFDETGIDTNVVNDYHFTFINGSTACELDLPESVNIGDIEIQPNSVCEVSIINGLLSFQNWSIAE